MKTYYIVSVVGRDRPGLVNQISRVLHQRGANIELQRSTRMAAEFAMLLLFSCNEADAGMEDALKALNSEALYVSVRGAVQGDSETGADGHAMEIVASGADQPGIVEAVTLLLFKKQINIESMNYDTECAPMSGEELFRLQARVQLPEGLELDTLRAGLRELEEAYNFDVLIEP